MQNLSPPQISKNLYAKNIIMLNCSFFFFYYIIVIFLGDGSKMAGGIWFSHGYISCFSHLLSSTMTAKTLNSSSQSSQCFVHTCRYMS